MPKPPHLAPLNAEEQWLYSELLPDGRASHPISKGEPSHPTEEAHFGRLYPKKKPSKVRQPNAISARPEGVGYRDQGSART
ncbi:hypothetical protein D4764_17G0006560 [Takifugu flavidus]|uniref:Uncharacterized protein n=1 Tax=Takifugu flavidus TaxID=433684 RepID=A0A5C6NV37_9TELE|nr:hypothetical protein D4764_17G0006560 [Takifugu flavidus]